MKIKVFTLNCWAIGYVPNFIVNCPDRKARIKALAFFLANHNHEVVCLQEVWTESDQEIIRLACQDNLPYSTTFHG